MSKSPETQKQGLSAIDKLKLGALGVITALSLGAGAMAPKAEAQDILKTQGMIIHDIGTTTQTDINYQKALANPSVDGLNQGEVTVTSKAGFFPEDGLETTGFVERGVGGGFREQIGLIRTLSNGTQEKVTISGITFRFDKLKFACFRVVPIGEFSVTHENFIEAKAVCSELNKERQHQHTPPNKI